MSNSNAPVHFKWAPISDFEANPKSLTDGELVALKRVWDGQKQLLDPKAIEQFNIRLKREWSIETGIIENVYSLDRGVTRNLIHMGIDAAFIPHDSANQSPAEIARVIQDQLEVLEGMLDLVGGARDLTVGYIKELHAALLKNQDTYAAEDPFGKLVHLPLEKGIYKRLPNSPTRRDGSVHEYCPPEHVASEMERLVDFHSMHQSRGIPVEVEAAWLHHRFTQIHPFADGNGRVARAIASLVFIKAGWFPLLIGRDDIVPYIDALEKGDSGSLQPLVALFVEKQRMAVIQATEAAHQARPPQSADEVIEAVRDRLVQKGRVTVKEWRVAKEVASPAIDVAFLRMGELAAKLNYELDGPTRGFEFQSAYTYHHREFDEVTAKLGISVDRQEYERSLTLSLKTEREDRIHFTFCALGPRFRGFIVVLAYLVIQGESDARVAPERFQINYEEKFEEMKPRFMKWLESALVNLLDQWRGTL